MKHWIRFLAPAALAVTAWSSLAHASTPMSVFARVDAVTYEPNKAAATRVRIDGAFALHTGTTTGFTYDEPVAGYMYFACPAGQETACREQWLDIETSIGKKLCSGWGQQSTKGIGTVRSLTTTPQDPDTFDLGMGVQEAVFADGTCPKLLSFGAPVAPGVPAADAGSSGTSGTSGTSSGATPAPTGGTPGTSAPPPGAVSSSNGCMSAPGSTPLSAFGAGAAIAAALLVARRRRK